MPDYLVGYNVDRLSFVITAEFWDKRPQMAPCSAISNGKGKYLLEGNLQVSNWVKAAYPDRKISPAARAAMMKLEYEASNQEEFPADFVYKNPPLDKQVLAIHRAYRSDIFALFMQVGTGKTYVTINVASALYQNQQIDSVIVMCPTGVKPVWEIEVEKHSPIDSAVFVLESGNKAEFIKFANTETDKIKYIVAGIEALSQGEAANLLKQFAARHWCLGVVDESHLIKNPKSIRTDNATAIGGLCHRRMILTGTSTTQGIEDLFAQFRYLDWRIIGNKSFFSFKAKYCITGGYQNRAIVGYQNQDELLAKISPFTFIVSKDEMLDLPEQIYEKVFVEPTPEQNRALKDLGDPFMMSTVVDDVELVVETVLERMLRYQQIVGGHFPLGDGARTMPMPGKNPKMNAMMEIIEGLRPEDKVIIWARFVAETNLIYNYLEDMYPGAACLYVGSTPAANRRNILEAFQTDPKVRFFVSNQTVGGAGITLTAANTTIYYSNTFSYKDREQSEGRNHRKGQDNKVTYFDIVMKHKIDRMIIEALNRKKSIDQYVREELTSMQNVSIS